MIDPQRRHVRREDDSASSGIYITDLPPGKTEGLRGKSVWGVPQGGRKTPLRSVQSKTEQIYLLPLLGWGW